MFFGSAAHKGPIIGVRSQFLVGFHFYWIFIIFRDETSGLIFYFLFVQFKRWCPEFVNKLVV